MYKEETKEPCFQQFICKINMVNKIYFNFEQITIHYFRFLDKIN